MSKNIAIAGAGISGLSCAYKLSTSDHHITVYAKEFSPNITSNRAAAFWFPYHIRNDKRGIRWCRTSFSFYEQMSHNPTTGISMHKIIKAIREGVEEETTWLDFMPPYSYKELKSKELPDGYVKGYSAMVPLIETQIFLPYLMNMLKATGVSFIEQEIKDLSQLTSKHDIVINCTALGARTLCNDETIIPVRGQVCLLSPRKGLPVFLDNEKPLYIVPRQDAIIIGGTYEENVFDETTEPETIEMILQKAYEVMPELKEQNVTGSWAGLRPYRPQVRLEKEGNIIHNYGHGGSGFTLAFGCAEEVVRLAEEI